MAKLDIGTMISHPNDAYCPFDILILPENFVSCYSNVTYHSSSLKYKTTNYKKHVRFHNETSNTLISFLMTSRILSSISLGIFCYSNYISYMLHKNVFPTYVILLERVNFFFLLTDMCWYKNAHVYMQICQKLGVQIYFSRLPIVLYPSDITVHGVCTVKQWMSGRNI